MTSILCCLTTIEREFTTRASHEFAAIDEIHSFQPVAPKMVPSADASPDASWSTEFNTTKRQRLFRDPPGDKTAYPTLAATIAPHVESFNNIFAEKGQLYHALRDIGTKTFFDGNPATIAAPDGEPQPRRNRLEVRVKDVFLDKSVLPTTNKIDKKREILPVECRERHVSYRGRFRARFEWRINQGEWKESVRDFGLLPIMLKVGLDSRPAPWQEPCQTIGMRRMLTEDFSQTDVICRTFHQKSWSTSEKRRKSLESISLSMA